MAAQRTWAKKIYPNQAQFRKLPALWRADRIRRKKLFRRTPLKGKIRRMWRTLFIVSWCWKNGWRNWRRFPRNMLCWWTWARNGKLLYDILCGYHLVRGKFLNTRGTVVIILRLSSRLLRDYYMRTSFWNLIGLEQWYSSLIWNTYMWKLQTFCGY